MKQFVVDNKESLYGLLKELCLIPAPSHFEDERAKFCKSWFDKNCANGAYIDEVKNVIFPYNVTEDKPLTVFCAHTDTVFPDTEPMPYLDDGEFISCPGVGDDTASLAVLMHVAKYFSENKIKTENGVLFVANSCEEGLGNLKGTRELFKNYAGKIKEFVSLDASMNVIHETVVGSVRYDVSVKTEGGHSYGKFGNKNAIAVLAEIIGKIYEINVPKIENSKTTYNVGEIRGGTSVNTIAESASMLCEYRSDNVDCLEIMKGHFEKIFKEAESEEVKVSVKIVGERPCASNELDLEKQKNLADRCEKIISKWAGKPVVRNSASTDCNIPLSLAVPAVATGVYYGSGAHTRAEKIEKASLPIGLGLALELVAELTKGE
jgi:acetylornithine deacetylase/succinyl-diaminopimelate desuccinylase-like protein